MDKNQIAKNLLTLKGGTYTEAFNHCQNMLGKILDKSSSHSLIFDAINSADINEKQAGIFLLVLMADDTNLEEDASRIFQFSKNLLKTLTMSNCTEPVIKLATKAISYLILTSKSNAIELMEVALNHCFEWLEEPQRNEQKRLAAVILAKDLAIYTQSHFFQRANQFFNNIFKILRETKPQLRQAAAEALRAALAVTAQREAKHKSEWYNKCIKEACNIDFNYLTRDDVLHGSLLIFNELLRIANYKQENLFLEISIIQSNKRRITIGQNPIEWLIEPYQPTMAVESRTSRTIVTDYFQEIVKKCFETRNSKAAICQLLLLEMFPRLASFIDTNFSTPFRNVIEAADHSLSIVNKYPEAMVTLGFLALSRPLEIRPKLMQILNLIVQHTQMAISKKRLMQSNDFKCISLIVRSQRSFLNENIKELLPLLFATGISPGLINVMHTITEEIPELKDTVFDHIMDQLYQSLMDRPRPGKLAPPTAAPLPTGPILPANIPQTILALKTLGKFDFSRHSLQMFLRYVAMGYLISESVEIRLTAVNTCAEMIKPFIKIYDQVENRQKAELYLLIRNVLECLVKTSIVDTDCNVRLKVMKCFCNMERDLLIHLAENEILETIFMTLQDENFQVREKTVELLGRLTDFNPAFIFLKFRRVLLESISQLVNSRTPNVEEHGARMIGNLARRSPRFMSPYLYSTIIALIPHLKIDRSNTAVSIAVLDAINELALIGGLEFLQSIDKIFPALIAFLQDVTSLNRREAALRAMGRICQSTGYVVQPYKDYTNLLEVLLNLLKTELSSSMRRLTMKVLGIIGALDPYTWRVWIGKIQSDTKSRSLALTLPNSGESIETHGMDIINWINYEKLNLKEYYQALAVTNLLQMLQEPQRATIIHTEIVHSLYQIFTTLSNRAQYIGQVIPQLIIIAQNCGPDLRELYLNQISKFVSLIRLQLQPYMPQFFGFISKAWYWSEEPGLRSKIIQLVEEVGSSFGENFAAYVTDLCPYLLNVLQNDKSSERKLTHQALSCTRTIVNCLGTHIHIIILPILLVIEDREAPDETRLAALETIIELSARHPIMDKAPMIMQTWLRCIPVKFLQKKLMSLLLIIIQKWDQFPIFKDSVNAALKRARVDQILRQEYREQLSNIQAGITSTNNNNENIGLRDQGLVSPTFPRQIQLLPVPERGEQSTSAAAYSNQMEMDSKIARLPSVRDMRHQVNFEQLRRFLATNTQNSREDWLQWLSTLRIQFIKQSSSSSIRACTTLADKNESLAKELFNAAFVSIWTEIPEPEQNELVIQLIDVLRNCPHAEPIQTILNLAEFMDHSEKGPLPIDYNVLSKAAESTRANSKALRYKELDIITTKKGEPTAEDCQYLIILYKKLNLEEGAVGVVQYAKRNNMEISGRWYEKLGEWEKALEMYKQEMLAMPDSDSWQTLSSGSSFTTMPEQQNIGGLQQAEMSTATKHSLSIQGEPSLKSQKSHHSPNNSKGTVKFDLVLHQMRCLEALGQWKQLNLACQTTLIENEADIHMESQGHQHHQSGGNQQPARNLDMANEFLNTTLSAIARRQKIAQMAAKASWALGDYEKMDEYVKMVNENTQEGSFMRAVLAIRNNEFGMAQDYINKVRDIFDSELTAMATESYDRAYGAMVLLQELTELEEAIEYKMLPEREIRIALLWSRRLQGCRPNIEHWRRILMVRSIVFEQKELRPLWIKFASLCRREGKQLIARNVIRSLLEVPPEVPFENINIPLDKPQLALALCKQMWTDGHRIVAFSLLEQLTQKMHRLIEMNRLALSREHLEPMAKITAKCYLKLGEWHESLYQPIVVPMMADRRGSVSSPFPLASMATASTVGISHSQQQFWNVPIPQRSPLPAGYGGGQFEQPSTKKLHYYIVASSFDQNWYKAWHRLATTYYNLVISERQSQQATIPQSASAAMLTGMAAVETGGPGTGIVQHSAMMTGSGYPSTSSHANQTIPPMSPIQQSPLRSHQLITSYAVNAVRCLFKAIQLAEGSRLNDTLRLLMLWFDFGDRPEVYEQLRDSLKLIPPEVWLEVVPQLIARLDSQQNTGILVKQLVIDVTKAYPQAWIYALTAAAKSRNIRRSQVAKEILEIVAENKPILVEQAMLVNDELIRCAILWHEQWHEALEEASRFYFQDKNVDEMINVLRPLHQRIEAGHTTMKEQSFNQTYYKDLKDALEHCEAFRRTGNQKEMTAAWDLYYNVFKRISNQLRQMSTLDLNYISPKLSKIRNLEVSIPGTYDPATPLITISMIHPHLQVIMSKQRPRKIYMRGSDGKEYAFLLKGHEDPRQDERVMQLFGLINSLILRQPETCRQNLAIQRYSITTLSQSSGLIGWVPNCDTLHALIKDYREKRKIPISEEHNKMQSLCIDIDKCTLLQKVEVFEEAMRTTSGDDLRQTLWMKSPNSEVWFDRRTNYTRSMSVMSMVGYILGLGDRHPSNLMLDRISGKIVHIDFGDCFEVAMKREKYPEKIPFRLTRMLIQAMEVTGIDGNFRLTCERVLRLLRSNDDSILAVLESFVYDPVLNWRFAEGMAAKRAMIPPNNGTGAEMGPGVIGGADGGGAIPQRNWRHPQEEMINRRGATGGKLLMMRDQQQNAAKMLAGEAGAAAGGGKRGDSEAINRVKSKLCGRDFNPYVEIAVAEQVDRLIEQATLPDNLCQCYIGWCPFW